jgi:hypothetical protein
MGMDSDFDKWRWMAMDGDGQQWTTINGKWQWTVIVMDGDYDDDGVVKRFASVNSVTMVCRREERKFFLLFRVLKKKLFSSLLQRIL